ncbi:hypothetical protein HPP92_006624 [Vanilla planifolia]|uniref:Uncharacterized protein n=1 Tax=Vanilla planifolia TaxID=51239 RepID=A0A835V5D2_VANPL|nr:hypothetical protein HPP92_006890 [Vanilla planifolia]KAG0489761.1 hypothetical protein HPP92_006624 [Vanilla planifolia]
MISASSRPRSKASEILHYGAKDMAFNPYGEYWRQLKKLTITQLLSSKKVQSFAPLLAREVAQPLQTISVIASDGGVVSLTEVSNWFTNVLVCKAVLEPPSATKRKSFFPS